MKRLNERRQKDRMGERQRQRKKSAQEKLYS